MKQAIFAYVNHAGIRSVNQPVLSSQGKVSCSRKQRKNLLASTNYELDTLPNASNFFVRISLNTFRKSIWVHWIASRKEIQHTTAFLHFYPFKLYKCQLNLVFFFNRGLTKHVYLSEKWYIYVTYVNNSKSNMTNTTIYCSVNRSPQQMITPQKNVICIPVLVLCFDVTPTTISVCFGCVNVHQGLNG